MRLLLDLVNGFNFSFKNIYIGISFDIMRPNEMRFRTLFFLNIVYECSECNLPAYILGPHPNKNQCHSIHVIFINEQPMQNNK